jgi:hypothetical protein
VWGYLIGALVVAALFGGVAVACALLAIDHYEMGGRAKRDEEGSGA